MGRRLGSGEGVGLPKKGAEMSPGEGEFESFVFLRALHWARDQTARVLFYLLGVLVGVVPHSGQVATAFDRPERS